MSHKKNRGRLKSLRVERTANGITVHHEHEPAKSKKGAKNGMPYESDYADRHEEYSFNDHNAAHDHVAKHMAALFNNDEPDGDEADGDEAPASPKDVKPQGRFIRR